jgi:hypothetical protein
MLLRRLLWHKAGEQQQQDRDCAEMRAWNVGMRSCALFAKGDRLQQQYLLCDSPERIQKV